MRCHLARQPALGTFSLVGMVSEEIKVAMLGDLPFGKELRGASKSGGDLQGTTSEKTGLTPYN